MRETRFFQFLLILGTMLFMMGVLLYFQGKRYPLSTVDRYCSGLIAQNTYMGPIQPIPGNPHLIRVEVLVRDSPELGGVQIQNVQFDGQTVPLKPRDIFGQRGQASFQLPPGKYTLKWVVQRDKVKWPRTVRHEEEVNIDPRDLWIQIAIDGEEVSIQ